MQTKALCPERKMLISYIFQSKIKKTPFLLLFWFVCKVPVLDRQNAQYVYTTAR